MWSDFFVQGDEAAAEAHDRAAEERATAAEAKVRDLQAALSEALEAKERAEARLDAGLRVVYPDPARLAAKFHRHYERLAPQYRYTTRPESAVPWHDVPEPNRTLMVKVAEAVIAELCADARAGR